MQKRFKKAITSLDRIFDFTGEFTQKHKLPESVVFSINFAIEEIFTNMVKYDRQTPHDILIVLEKTAHDVTISLTDFEVDRFDVTTTEDVDTTQPVAERKVGGLGLHLVKRVVDDVIYEYKDKNSKITLIKCLEK
ncbi:MAG: ATP-binding protein [bacterium]